MNDTALIFGAGKTGRGFAAHLAFLGGYDIVLVDKNRQLVAALKSANQFDVEVLGNAAMNCTIPVTGVYHIEDTAWHAVVETAGVIFTAVFGNNLEELGRHLAPALAQRHSNSAAQALTIITCENLTGAAGVLQTAVLQHTGEEGKDRIAAQTGFSESIIFKTCLGPAADQPPLTIRAQNFFELPCDGDAVKGALHVFGLKPLPHFGNQLKRKIYTYNCINAVIAYLGAKKGYTQLHEAGNDADILAVAKQAAQETARAQVAEFGFDSSEQQTWVQGALAKFADQSIPDPIDRNAADPARKLGKDDRLIGPALLAVKHGIYPAGLLQGIIACIEYHDPQTKLAIADLIRDQGADRVLQQICGLPAGEKLAGLIKQIIQGT